MRTVERPVETLGEPLRKTNRYLVAALSFLMLLVVGFGAWLLIDEYTGVDREIELVARDWYDAWDRGDGEAVLAMMSPTARHYDSDGVAGGVGGDQLAALVESVTVFDFAVVGEPLIVEKLAPDTYVVAVEGQISNYDGISVFRLRRSGDEWLITYHRWVD